MKTKGRERGYEERPKVSIDIFDKRSKEEIDAIIRAADATSGIQIKNTAVEGLSAPMKQIPEVIDGEIVEEE